MRSYAQLTPTDLQQCDMRWTGRSDRIASAVGGEEHSLRRTSATARRLQAEARLLAELDALKREQQADGARIKQEVRRSAVRAPHTVARHSSLQQQRRPAETNGNVPCHCAHCAHRPLCTGHITRNPSHS